MMKLMKWAVPSLPVSFKPASSYSAIEKDEVFCKLAERAKGVRLPGRIDSSIIGRHCLEAQMGPEGIAENNWTSSTAHADFQRHAAIPAQSLSAAEVDLVFRHVRDAFKTSRQPPQHPTLLNKTGAKRITGLVWHEH